VNATRAPSPEIDGEKDAPLPWSPAAPRLTLSVLAATKSRRKTSPTPLVSPVTRLDASESNATKRPSAEIVGEEQTPFALPPLVETETTSVTPATRSRR
jgi:hypothetical protein